MDKKMPNNKKISELKIVKKNTDIAQEKIPVLSENAELMASYIVLNECASAARDVHSWIKDLLTKIENFTKEDIIEELKEIDELMDVRLGTTNKNAKSWVSLEAPARIYLNSHNDQIMPTP